MRSDAQTGQDSTAGLNRDTSKAYEITRDEEERTDLYASQSSIEAVSHPRKTLAQWQAGLENYGSNASQAFLDLGILRDEALAAAEQDQLVAALAWIPALLVGAMDRLGGKATLGIFPSVANHGGFITQIPVLIDGDVRYYQVEVVPIFENGMIKLNDEGKPILDKSKTTYTLIDRPNNNSAVFANGIQNSLSDAIVNGFKQTESYSFVQAYNPEHGLLGDGVEALWDSVLGGVVRSGNARELNSFYQSGIDQSLVLSPFGHSQGGLLTWLAMQGLDFSKGGSLKVGAVQLSGAPVDAVRFHEDALAAGFSDNKNRIFQVNRPDTYVLGVFPMTDSVADLPMLGGNAKYSVDRVSRTVGALFSLGVLFDSRLSPHSNYLCQTAQCKNIVSGVHGDLSRGDKYIVPTIIDARGEAQKAVGP